MRTTTTRPSTTTAAVGAAALHMLTGRSGCEGCTALGTCHGETGKGSGRAIIVISGGTLTRGPYGCDTVSDIDMDDPDASTGTLDKTRATAAGTREDRYCINGLPVSRLFSGVHYGTAKLMLEEMKG